MKYEPDCKCWEKEKKYCAEDCGYTVRFMRWEIVLQDEPGFAKGMKRWYVWHFYNKDCPECGKKAKQIK